MISISKTQNTTLKIAKYTSFAQKHIYLRGFFNDNSIQIPSSLKKFLECFNDLTNTYSVYSVAFDANNNKLYVERMREYSGQFDLMQFDLTTLEEDKLGYSITVSGANWSKTVKTLNDYLGKEYAKMSSDKTTLIIENSNHAELKAVLQTVSRINSKVNKCIHNGLGRNAQYEIAMSRYCYLDYSNDPDMQQFCEHSKTEMLKYVKNVLKKTKFVENTDKCEYNAHNTTSRYLNYIDEKNFELVRCARISISSKTGDRYGEAAPDAWLRVIYKVVNGKASWKLMDDTSYARAWQKGYEEVKVNGFDITICDRNGYNTEVCKGYAAYLLASIKRVKEYDALIDTIKKAVKA
jgi:hypothetical protein